MNPAPQYPKQLRMRRRGLVLAVAFAGLSMMAAAAPKPAVHTVVIDGMQFSPAVLEVNAGDTVIWKNKDPFPHTATADGKTGFDSGEMATGRSWKFKAMKRGTFPYVCTLHRTMTGSLVVK
jgi:plastocyanin